MGLLDDLDLGKDQFNKDRPVELSGLDAPLPKPEPNPWDTLFSGGPDPKSRKEKLHNWKETAPPAEPVVNQETQQAYKDIKSFDSDISKLTGDITRYGDIHGSKKKSLEDFHEGTLAPFWKDEFSEGFLETPDLDLNKPETVDSFISDIDSRYQQHQDRVDKGDTSWFGEDEALTRASGALRGKRKFELIRQKHARLLKDYHQSKAALERAKSRKSAMSETLMSLPENLRWAAKNWKEENPGKLLSKESVNKLLDDQKFEKPEWGPTGDLLNPGKLDPRIPLEDDGSDYMGTAIKGQKKRLEAVRRDGVSALEKDISDLEVKAGLKKHGFLYSVMGQVANRSIYISDAEKEAINVDRLQKAGITNYKGGSLEDAVNALGGEDRVIAATLIENVGNAHVAKERAKMRWIETLMTKGKEAATADLELADKNFNAAFNAAIQAGFGDEVVKRGRSDSYFGHLANSWKSGDLLEDATDFVPQLAGLADFSQTDAEKLIGIMTEMEGLETSETYEHYKLSEVDGFWDGIIHLGEHWRAIPEMVVDTLVAFTNTFATEAPRTVTPFAAGGALIGSPGGLAGAGAGGLAGTGWGLRANIGVTSFVLEYVGALLGELEKAGVDWHNPNELMAAFNNPTLMTELRTEATLKSGPVAILDMVAAGVAGKIMPIFKNPSAIKALPNGVKAFRQELRSGVHASAGRITAGAATELALQGALGGTGEALGQLLTLDPGEELDWKAIVAELGIEILGPGGVGFVHSYAKSKFGGYALEDISGATANVIGKEEVPGGFIEQVDQAGLKYERRRFHTAADYLNYVVEQTGMDLNTPTGFIVRKLVGFAQTAGKMGDLGIVVADRTPYKNKATRGAYSNGVIWLNRSALAGNPDSAPFVFLHEGGHYIQDMFFTPEQVETLYTKALPDEEARVLAWAQYKLGRSVEVLTDLSSTEQTIVNESYRSSPDAVVRAEWFTAQVAAALAIESGVVGGVTVDSAIKKAVKTMLKFVVSDETVDQFFPPQESIEQDGAIRIELLKALGFDPTTLQNNRAAFDTDIDSDAGLNQTVNPFTVNLDDMPNWPQNAKEVWARLMGYESWAKLPSKYKRTASDKGDKLKQREAAGEGDPFAEVDLSDPDTQKRIYESTDVSKKIASEEQQGGKGLEDTPVKSPEKPTPKSKLKKAVKSVKPKAQDPWLEPEPTEEAKQNVKSKVVGTSEMGPDEFINQSERKAVKKPTAAKQKANKEQDDAEAVKNRTELREKKEKKAAAKSAPQKLQDATDRILDAQALLNQDLEAEIRDAKSRIRKRRIAHIKSLSPARIKSAKGGKSALVKAASKIYPIDLLRDIVLNDAEANSDLVALLGTSSIHEELASDASALTAQQLKQLAEQLGNVLENELEYELAKPVPEISGVLIPYGIHKIPSKELQTVEGARTPGGTATITLAENVGEVGQLVNFQEEFVQGQRSQFNINPSVYAFEITGKSSTKSTITFELKAVTESQARKSVSWLDLPASAIPSRGKPNPFHYKEPIQLLNGGRIKKQNFKDPQSEVVRQYMSVEDALKGKSKVSITGWANRKGNKEVPVRAVSRLARAKSASGTGDSGILASYTDIPTNKLDKFEITSPEARSVAGMILAAIAPTTTTSKRRVSSMQQDLKAKYDPTVAAQKAANAGNRAGRFEQTKLRTLSDDKPLSALLGLYTRLKILEQGTEKPVGILGLADMMLLDLMGVESEFGFTKDQIRQEMVALTVVPNNEFMGNVDLFRAGIDIQAGESQQVAKRVDPRDDGSNATILSPTQEQRDVLDEDEAAKDAQSKGVAPSTIGTPDEGGSGESRVSSKKTRKEKAMPADLIVEDKDLAVETPKEGTWQHDFLNGVGKLKEYNWVRRLAAKLKKSGDIPKNQKVVSHPEIRELDANLSRAGEDQRHSDRLHITPRVLANMVERNGLDNLVSLPDTNKQGRVTEGGPAASALFWTGILTKIISNYGKITKGKNVPDAGITPADVQARARALFKNYKEGKLALEDWPWKQFVADFGGPVDSSLQATAADFKAGLKDEDVQRNAQRNAARRQFIFAYFAQWTRKRVAQLGGLEEKFGDKEATEGASEQVAEAPNEEGSVEEAEDLGAPSQVENLDGDAADIREAMFNGGDPIAGVIYKSLDEMTSGRTWALVSKYLDMTDAELAKDPQLRRLLKNQEVTPDQVRAMVKAALNKDQITNVTTDQQLQERLRTYIENTEKDAETKSKKGEKGRGAFGRTLGAEYLPENQLGMPEVFRDYFLPSSRLKGVSRRPPEEWISEIKKMGGMEEYAEDMGLTSMLRHTPEKSISADFIEGWLDANAPAIRVDSEPRSDNQSVNSMEGRYFNRVSLPNEYISKLGAVDEILPPGEYEAKTPPGTPPIALPSQSGRPSEGGRSTDFEVLVAHRPHMGAKEYANLINDHIRKHPEDRDLFKHANPGPGYSNSDSIGDPILKVNDPRNHADWTQHPDTIFFATFQRVGDVFRVEENQSDWNQKLRSEIGKPQYWKVNPTNPNYEHHKNKKRGYDGNPPLFAGWVNASVRAIIIKAFNDGAKTVAFHRELPPRMLEDGTREKQPVRIAMYSQMIPNALRKLAKQIDSLPKPTIQKTKAPRVNDPAASKITDILAARQLLPRTRDPIGFQPEEEFQYSVPFDGWNVNEHIHKLYQEITSHYISVAKKSNFSPKKRINAGKAIDNLRQKINRARGPDIVDFDPEPQPEIPLGPEPADVNSEEHARWSWGMRPNEPVNRENASGTFSEAKARRETIARLEERIIKIRKSAGFNLSDEALSKPPKSSLSQDAKDIIEILTNDTSMHLTGIHDFVHEKVMDTWYHESENLDFYMDDQALGEPQVSIDRLNYMQGAVEDKAKSKGYEWGSEEIGWLKREINKRIHEILNARADKIREPQLKHGANIGETLFDISNLTEEDAQRISLYGVVPKNIAKQVNEGKEKRQAQQGRTLGSELTLVSEMPALFSERMSAAFLSTARAGFNKIPEEWRYKIRVTMFNQHATMEDLAVKLNKDLKLKFGTDARDWFDMMGVILPTYAKVKIASRDFNSRFRQPILDMLKKHGVSETKFGRYVQALAAGTFNRHVRGLLVEARDSVNESIKSSTETIASHKKTLESEGVAEGTQKELKLAISRLEADIKKKEKDITEHYDDALYSNALGEFSPSGYSDKEAAGIVKSARNDRQLSQLLKEGEKDPSKSIMGLWAKMNATTVTHALETGQITQEEAFKLITAKSRAGSAKELVKIVFESLELDPTDAQYAADVEIIEKTFNSKNWKDQSRIDNELELPSGYYYAPMRGFEDNAFHYEETEALGDLIKIKPEAGQSGWGARRSNEISKRALGRRKGVDKPNPATALAHAFLDHDTMVMRGAKIAPAQRMREFYEVYLEMFRNRDNLDGNIEWSENFKEIAEANGITKLFEDPSKRKVIFREFNEVFDVINESADGSMPTVEGTRLKRKTVEGRTKLVLRKGEIPLSMNDPSILLVKQKGELKYIKFKMKYSGDGSKLTGPGARIKSELGNMNFVPTNPVLKFFNVPTRFLAQMYTSFNPDFILANAVRDTINALGNIREDEKKKIFKDVAALLNPANFYKVTKGIYKVERSHDEGSRSKEFAKLNRKQALAKLADNDWEGWFKFFEAHGLRTAFTSPDQMTNLMEDIQKALGTTPTGIKKKIGKAKAAVLESKFVKIVEASNAGVENTVRLVVAQRLLKSGFTVQQAVMAGRNISVDFNRKGTLSSSFGSLILFFNAGVQGNLRFIRALANRDGGAAKIAVGIMSASFLWGTLQRLLTGHDEDEDGEKEGNHYDNLGDFTKDSNIVAFVPGTEFNGRIPLPWGWNLLWMMGQKAANVAANHFGPAMGGSGVIANGASAMDNIYNTFNPVGETAMPGVFAPLYQVMQNETFYGAPITDKDRDFGTTTPASERSRKGTKDFFVDASKSINAWLGGDEISPGSLRRMFGDGEVANEMDDMLWGLSGSDLEHLFEGYTGGVGATFSRFVSGAYAGIKGNVDVNLKEVPVARRFLREGYSNYIISKRFYGLRKRTNVAGEYVGNLKSGKNIEAAKEGIEANKDLLKIKPMVDAADTKRKTILRLIDKVNASKLPQSVKDQKIKEYEKQRLASWLKVLYKARKMGISV